MASSSLSKTTAGPRCLSIVGLTPAVLTTAPSGARLPKRTARPPASPSTGSRSGGSRRRPAPAPSPRCRRASPVTVGRSRWRRPRRESRSRIARTPPAAWTSSMCHGPRRRDLAEVGRPVGDLVDAARSGSRRRPRGRWRACAGPCWSSRPSPRRARTALSIASRGDDVAGRHVRGDQVDDLRGGGLREARRARGRGPGSCRCRAARCRGPRRGSSSSWR